MEKFGFEKAGLVIGDVVALNANEEITFVVANVTPDRVDLLVGGDLLEADLGPAEATNIAKRLDDDRYSDATTFHTPREWNYEGVRLTNMIEGNTPAGQIGATGAQGDRVVTRQVEAQVCGRCFIAMPLTNECPFCD